MGWVWRCTGHLSRFLSNFSNLSLQYPAPLKNLLNFYSVNKNDVHDILTTVGFYELDSNPCTGVGVLHRAYGIFVHNGSSCNIYLQGHLLYCTISTIAIRFSAVFE